MTGRAKISTAFAARPNALVTLGCSLMASGHGDKAVALVEQLLAETAPDPGTDSVVRTVMSHKVPHWHLPMLRETARNDAFEAAITGAVTPQTRVLDIGAGSGLLAMMAARTGAGAVIACEAHKALAATAREIVAANGLSDRVAIIAKHSTDLDVVGDLGGPVDLVVTETFANDLIGEGALKALRHALRSLASPSVRIIPARASIRIALAHFAGDAAQPIGKVSGFDLGLINRHAAPALAVPVGDERLELCSEPADLFAFDFSGRDTPSEGQTEVPLIAGERAPNGVVQWIRLQLDEQNSYENAPARGSRSHWAAHFHPFDAATTAANGPPIRVNARHDGERLRIWCEGGCPNGL